MITAAFIAIQLGFVLFIFYLCLAFVTGAPFVPSTNPTAKTMIKLAKLKPGMKVYDLGSGNGKLLFLAAQSRVAAVGFEINPFLVLWTKLRIRLSPFSNLISVHWRNFWQLQFSDADVVFVYLLPWRMEKLAAFLKKQLKPGALIVSNSFIFPNWRILRQDLKLHVYVFRVS